MASYQEIMGALEKDPKVLIVGAVEPYCTHLPDSVIVSSSIYLAPKFGIYSRKELQQLLDDLLPGIPVGETYDFVEGKDGLEIGRRVYYDSAGEERITTHRKFILNGKTMRKVPGGLQGTTFSQVTRRDIPVPIIVGLYPNKEFATAFSQHDEPFQIPADLIQQYAQTSRTEKFM